MWSLGWACAAAGAAHHQPRSTTLTEPVAATVPDGAEANSFTRRDSSAAATHARTAGPRGRWQQPLALGSATLH